MANISHINHWTLEIAVIFGEPVNDRQTVMSDTTAYVKLPVRVAERVRALHVTWTIADHRQTLDAEQIPTDIPDFVTRHRVVIVSSVVTEFVALGVAETLQ